MTGQNFRRMMADGAEQFIDRERLLRALDRITQRQLDNDPTVAQNLGDLRVPDHLDLRIRVRSG
ncbi:hypothetical protein KY084_14955 [Stakelama sp. CBK3Z-3]|uniref:Type II toxin-antitoxin system RelE/ParE family toxin n=1 Tax=Stakelama flava TaxID=2860338 RepID=A0ABS6XRV4_9SPHN|nr:hypothetical protein [Stakelama flava]MBW4332160.1 hypothetical protein [Stakelama flava]